MGPRASASGVASRAGAQPFAAGATALTGRGLSSNVSSSDLKYMVAQRADVSQYCPGSIEYAIQVKLGIW